MQGDLRARVRGAWVALVTPFVSGRVDEQALRRLVRQVLGAGVEGLVPNGSTGEAGSLDRAERRRVLELVVEEAAGRALVVAGTGAQSTSAAVELTREARAGGAWAALVVTPPYAKPTQEGLYRHFTTVADEGGLPLVLYNIPGRTAVNLDPATVARLAAHPGIIGLKESTGSCEAVTRIRESCDLPVLCGDDALTLPFMALGARGVVSVAGNVVPGRVVELVHACDAGRMAEARAAHDRLAPLVRALFLEPNPAPVKAALAMLGLAGNEVRLPLVAAGPATEEALGAALAAFGEAVRA